MKRFLAVVLMWTLAAPAAAAEWEMYGSARVGYFYSRLDEEAARFLNGAEDSDFDLDFGLTNESHIGAAVKVNDALAGQFEYLAAAGSAELRLLYGVYSFGTGSLLVGQDWTPIAVDFSNQVIDADDNLASVGAPDDGYLPQIKLKMGGFEVALIQNQAASLENVPALDADVKIPKIEMVYQYTTDRLFIMPFAGYQVFELENDDASYTLTAYVVGARSRVALGPAYINLSASYAQNAALFGLSSAYQGITNQTVIGGDGEVNDSREVDLAAVAGLKASETISFEAGVGYTNSALERFDDGDWEQTTWVYYANAQVTIAPGFSITPEVGMYDFGDLETDDGDTDLGVRVYYGAKLQIDF